MYNDDWGLDTARELWGLNHEIRGEVITVDSDGYLIINLNGYSIRVKDLVEERGFDVAYIRILPLIEKAMEKVYETFKELSKVYGFKGVLQPVYPMKVNPIDLVVEAIWRYGEKYKWGFNTGSLGEVKTLLKYAGESSRVLIYDGVLSSQVIDILLKFRDKKWKVIVDVEGEHDLNIVSGYPELEIGLRVKPLTKPGGKWAHSAGLEGKFGFSVSTLAKLRDEYKWIEERATLLHMHPGSQIYKWSDMEAFLNEVYDIYKKLRSSGFNNLKIVDPGGGLAYPYIDTGRGTPESPNYTLRDYLGHIVKVFSELEDHPVIVYEGGRYIVASHRIVVSKVVDIRPYTSDQYHASSNQLDEKLAHIESISDLKKLIRDIRTHVRRGFSEPRKLEERELLEELVTRLHDDIASKLREIVEKKPALVEEILNDPVIYRFATSPSKRYILNFSVFADIPDTVIVNQYFQVVPLQRLDERPDVLATLGDLTCDSMGEIGEYISDVKTPIKAGQWFTRVDSRLIMVPGRRLKLGGVPLHLPVKDENYYIAFLDTGAYQDPLAMKHNLIYGAPEIVIDTTSKGVEVKIIEKKGDYL